jgi:hypothetical protein
MPVTQSLDDHRRTGFFDAHALLQSLGAAEARRATTTVSERVCIDAAIALREATGSGSRLIYGSLAVTCLPYRDPGPDKRVWRKRGGLTTFAVTPGASGFPFGAKVRVMLLHLIDKALRSDSAAVEVGSSMREYLQLIGVPLGGMSYHHVGEQSRRLAGCGVRIVASDDPSAELLAAEVRGFISSFEIEQSGGAMETLSPDQMAHSAIFPKRVVLDPGFFAYVSKHEVILDRVAIQQVSDNGWALDLYIWLATELPRLAAPLYLPWSFLYHEGYADHGPMYRIKAKLISTLPLVAAIYPEARLRIEDDGLWLLPSPAPLSATPSPSRQSSESQSA